LNVAFDAAAIINLTNGDVFEKVLVLPSHTFFVGPQVKEECARQIEHLDKGIENGRLTELDDSKLPSGLFVELLQEHGLGLGETECLAFAKVGSLTIASDDRQARREIAQEIGVTRLTGSLGLMRLCVQAGIMSPSEAFAAYEKMKLCGGFLPDIPPTFFSN